MLEKGRTAALHITNGHLVLSNYEYGGGLGIRCDLDFRVSGDWLGQDAPQELMYRVGACLLYTSPSPRDATLSRMPSSA